MLQNWAGYLLSLITWTSLVAHMVKRLPTMWETWVQFLGREDPLEKEMAPHSSTLAWRIPWTEEPGRLQSMGSLKSRTWLSNFTFTFQFHALEKEMATHSSVLAWRIPGTAEPGGLPSLGLHRVGHDWSDLAAAAAAAAAARDRKLAILGHEFTIT